MNSLSKINHHCVELFDEMSIYPALTNNKKNHNIVALLDCGDGKRLQPADHAVFMVRRVEQKWKQPIAFFFSGGAMKSVDVAT